MDKQHLRRLALEARKAQPDKQRLSEAAVRRVLQLPEYQRAQVAIWYLDSRSELRTRWAMPHLLDSGKRILVPFCTEDVRGQPMLGLWRLHSVGELVPGAWKILEPPPDRRDDPSRRVAPTAADIVLAPGLGFTRQGTRLGHGQGYFDRLLASVRRDCAVVGLCYECQLFATLPAESHDKPMDLVVTERAVYPASR